MNHPYENSLIRNIIANTPNTPDKIIKISKFKNKLCGKFRPGHFNAVVDVVERFTNIINPHKIYLGNKDMQQLKLIESFFAKKQCSG